MCISVFYKKKEFCKVHNNQPLYLGSFSDEDVKKKKNNRFITQNNNFVRASCFFVHFFTVLARLRRENA